MRSHDFGKKRLPLSGPNERFRLGVVRVDVIADGLFEGGDAWERAAADSLGDDLAEEPFHQIQPGAAGGDEVHVESRMTRQPTHHPRMLVRGVIVYDQMQVQV